jgi:hypothetical protein
MSENSENKEIKTSGLRPPTKIPTMGVSRLPSSSSIKLGESVFILNNINIITLLNLWSKKVEKTLRPLKGKNEK